MEGDIRTEKNASNYLAIRSVCLKLPVARSKIRIWSSFVTTAYQSNPCVKVLAVMPEGSVITSGKFADGSEEKRMTSNAKMAKSPRIMVAVKSVTKRRKNRRFAGSSI